MNDTQRFREKIRTTLMSERCQKIVLAFDQHRITGLDYSYIALAMLQPIDAVVGIDVRNDYPGKGSAGFRQRDVGGGRPIAAFLSPKQPWFTNTIHEQLIIMHESTHAVFAAWKVKGATVRRLTNEAIAYIAEAAFNRLGTAGDAVFNPAVDDRPPPASKLTQDDRNVLIAADSVAQRVIRRTDGNISGSEISDVEVTLIQHPLYNWLLYAPNSSQPGTGINLAHEPPVSNSILRVLR